MKYQTLFSLLLIRLKFSSVRAISKKSKISPSTISRISRGGVPDLHTYFKLCRWLDIEAPFSIGFKNKKFKL